MPLAACTTQSTPTQAPLLLPGISSRCEPCPRRSTGRRIVRVTSRSSGHGIVAATSRQAGTLQQLWLLPQPAFRSRRQRREDSTPAIIACRLGSSACRITPLPPSGPGAGACMTSRGVHYTAHESARCRATFATPNSFKTSLVCRTWSLTWSPHPLVLVLRLRVAEST